MAKSTGIVLAATGISFSNEWLTTGTPNFRVGIAGLGVALLFDGIEKINQTAAIGLATIMLITVLVTPFEGLSPVETVAKWGTGTGPTGAATASDVTGVVENPQNAVSVGDTASGSKLQNPQGALAGAV